MSSTGQMRLGDEDFFFANIHGYIDASLASSDQKRFELLLQQESFKERFDQFKDQKGHLQFALQGHFLNESETLRLRGFVQNHNQATAEDNRNIQEIDRKTRTITMARKLAFLAVIGLVVFYAVNTILPDFRERFDAMRFLSYEAIALDQQPEARLELRIADTAIIAQYLEKYPNLNFKAQMLRKFSDQWEPSGATILDYDFTKVALVQYRRPLADAKTGETPARDPAKPLQSWEYEYLYHFSFPEQDADIVLRNPATTEGMPYYTFQTDDHNFVVWNSGAGILSMLVGKDDALTLAGYARKGQP